MAYQYTSRGLPVAPAAAFLPTLRQIVIEDISTFFNIVNTFLILRRFLTNKAIYFSRERRWGTYLQLFWLLLYVGDNLNTILRLLLDDNPLDVNLKVQNFFMMHTGYVQFLMLIYKTQVIIMTYFRNKRRATFNENIPDAIFFVVTIALILTYARMGRLFATEDFFDMLEAYFQYNVTIGVLAVIALLVSFVLLTMIVRAEAESPFNNIILNRSMFWQFIALQIFATGFYDVLTFVQFARNKQNVLWLWFLATVFVDWPITFFEWHHKSIFIAATSGGATASTGGTSPTKSLVAKLSAVESQASATSAASRTHTVRSRENL
ncbi:hypothetical protein DFS34DRAFT_619865 [Phlyctochytrium arcticum]|nr:hypothetical protein DFS34DRAFT_619865 [Phlyctochytrium arcticum]